MEWPLNEEIGVDKEVPVSNDRYDSYGTTAVGDPDSRISRTPDNVPDSFEKEKSSHRSNRRYELRKVKPVTYPK